MRAVRLPYFRIDPRSEQVTCDGITELRVHGVNGAPPEQMLHDPHPLFVTGDRAAAFYRRRSDADGDSSAGQSKDRARARNIEAYSWNGLNSRSSLRAFWLLLFPFAITNFAGWLLPNHWSEEMKRFGKSLIRIIGLTLTVEATLVVALMAVDLVGFQCGSSAACRSLGWLGWFAGLHRMSGSLVRTVLIMGIVPLLFLGGLWLVGRRTGRNYDRYWMGPDEVTTATSSAERDEATALDDLSLRSPAFWQASKAVEFQANLHVAAAAAAVGIALTEALRDISDGRISRWPQAIWAAVVVAAVILVAQVGTTYRPTATGRSTPEGWLHGVGRTILALSLALFGIVAWQAWPLPLAEALDPAPLPGPRLGIEIVLLTQLALMTIMMALFPRIAAGTIMITVAGILAFDREPVWSWWSPVLAGVVVSGAAWWAYRRRFSRLAKRVLKDNTFWIVFGLGAATLLAMMSAIGKGADRWTRGAAVVFIVVWLVAFLYLQIRFGHDQPPSWQLRNGAPVVMAGIGCVVAAVISSSATIFLAERLGPAAAVAPRDRSSGAFAYPLEFEWIAGVAFGGLIVFVAALGIRAGCLWLFRWRPASDAIGASYDPTDGPIPGTVDLDAYERKAFAKKATNARWLAELTDDADWLLFASVAVMFAAAYAMTWTLLWNRDAGDLSGFVEIAVSGLSLVALGSIALVQRSRTDAGLRKLTGILWEVISFFPRRFHPLAPPCYAERSVPELRNRLIQLSEERRASIVLAHSEGTLITTAALLTMLDDEDLAGRLRQRIRLVTYGCMIRRLFGRAFPDHLREEDLAELKGRFEGVAGATMFPAEPALPPGWMNFARHSDFLGGRVFTELPPLGPDGLDDRADDIMLLDPTRRWRFVGETHDARLWRHSFDYVDPDEDPQFGDHVVLTADDLATSAEDLAT